MKLLFFIPDFRLILILDLLTQFDDHNLLYRFQLMGPQEIVKLVLNSAGRAEVERILKSRFGIYSYEKGPLSIHLLNCVPLERGINIIIIWIIYSKYSYFRSNEYQIVSQVNHWQTSESGWIRNHGVGAHYYCLLRLLIPINDSHVVWQDMYSKWSSNWYW